MFRQGGKHIMRRRFMKKEKEALALLARDDEVGSDGESSDVEELEEQAKAEKEKKEKEEKEKNENATRVAPGRPTSLPLPPGLQGPVDAVLPSGEPIQSSPGSPTSSAFPTSTQTTPQPTATPSPPSSPGILPIENPSTPALPTSTLSLSPPPSPTTSAPPTPTFPAGPTFAPNLPISFPSTFRTSTITTSSSVLSNSPPSSTTGIPVVGSPTSTPSPGPGLGPGPGADTTPNPAAQVNPPSSSLKPGAKAGIAMGTIAAVAMLGSLLFFLWRRYHLRKARDSLTFSTSPNFSPGAGVGAATTGDAPGAAETGPPMIRTDSQILDDLLTTAYAHQNGRSAPPPVTVEKGRQVLTVLDRVPTNDRDRDSVPDAGAIPNAEIRSSIASWLRRHHPLQLNGMASARNGNMNRASQASQGSTNMPRSPLSPGVSEASRDSVASIIVPPKSPGMPKSPGFRTKLRPPPQSRSPSPAAMTSAVPPPLPEQYRREQQQQQQQQGKYLSVWSDTTGTHTSVVSEGSSYYGQALGAPEEEEEVSLREALAMDNTGKRCSSPVLPGRAG